MIIELLAKKVFPVGAAAVFGAGYISDAAPTIDTVVMAKSNQGYMCSEVIALTEDEVPTVEQLTLKSCDSISGVPLNVRILTINS